MSTGPSLAEGPGLQECCPEGRKRSIEIWTATIPKGRFEREQGLERVHAVCVCVCKTKNGLSPVVRGGGGGKFFFSGSFYFVAGRPVTSREHAAGGWRIPPTAQSWVTGKAATNKLIESRRRQSVAALVLKARCWARDPRRGVGSPGGF